MTLIQTLFALLTVLVLSVGQVLFKLATVKLNVAEHGWLGSTIFNFPLMLALVVYGLATFAWLFVIKDVPLRIAYPFVAIAFVIVPILSHYCLHEDISLNTFIGAGLIIAGVCITSA